MFVFFQTPGGRRAKEGRPLGLESCVRRAASPQLKSNWKEQGIQERFRFVGANSATPMRASALNISYSLCPAVTVHADKPGGKLNSACSLQWPEGGKRESTLS